MKTTNLRHWTSRSIHSRSRSVYFKHRLSVHALTKRNSSLSYDPTIDIFLNVQEQDRRETNTLPSVRQPIKQKNLTFNDLSEMIDIQWTDYPSWTKKQSFIKEELERLPSKRLRCICQSYGLMSSGKKKELIDRIANYETTHSSLSCWRNGTPTVLLDLFLY